MPPNGTPFQDLARLCLTLEKTPARLEKFRLIGGFLRAIRPGEIAPAVLLITGTIFPEREASALNVGWATLRTTLDGPRQSTLLQEGLTVGDVQAFFQRLASVQGKDSVAARRRLLAAIMGMITSEEREILLRNIFGEMRIGVNEGVMVEAVAHAAALDADLVRRALLFTGDLGHVATVAMTKGAEGLGTIALQLMQPLKPMMAEMAETLAEVLEEHGGTTALEYKFDGARIQIHRLGETVRIFSRRLTEVTHSLPEVVSLVLSFPSREFILEGEVIAVDRQGRVQPFQELMRRFRRVHNVEEAMGELPLRLYIFDVLYLEGRMLIDLAQGERWEAMAGMVPEAYRAPRLITSNVEEANAFLRAALDAGHEGLMAKDLHSSYVPGKRGRRWFKVKKADFLDVVITAAEWGHGRRVGSLSNYHLAIRDQAGRLYMVGKTFKGLTDAERAEMTHRLLAQQTSTNGFVVQVKPTVVVEVAYSDIQRSPHYDSGFALRFARIRRMREDKGVEDIDTLERLKTLHGRQGAPASGAAAVAAQGT